MIRLLAVELLPFSLPPASKTSDISEPTSSAPLFGELSLCYCCRSSAEIEDRASSSSPYGAVISSFRWGALQLFGNLMMRVSVNLVQIEDLPTSSVQLSSTCSSYGEQPGNRRLSVLSGESLR